MKIEEARERQRVFERVSVREMCERESERIDFKKEWYMKRERNRERKERQKKTEKTYLNVITWRKSARNGERERERGKESEWDKEDFSEVI